MGIYFKNIIATVIFENDKFSNILQENQFDKEIAAQKMIIIIRDIDQGKAGGGSPHQSSPSLKVKNGNKNDKHHSNDGDPIYFTKKGKPVFGAEEANLNKDEEIYLRNFILHNYLNLYNYWFAPRYCETKEFEKELQHEIQRRIQYNINHIDYRKKRRLYI